jgi:hypothetical protein
MQAVLNATSIRLELIIMAYLVHRLIRTNLTITQSNSTLSNTQFLNSVFFPLGSKYQIKYLLGFKLLAINSQSITKTLD